MEQKQPLGALLGESFRLLFRNYQLFLPYVVSLAVGYMFFFLPFYRTVMEFSVEPDAALTPELISALVILVIISLVLSLLVYGWVFAAIQPVVMGKNLEISREFRSGLRIAWIMFVQLLLVLAVALVAGALLLAVVMGIAASFALSPALGLALAILGVLALIALLLFLLGYGMQVGAALIVERSGPVASLVSAWRFVKENKAQSVLMMLIALGLFILASVPSVVMGALLGASQTQFMLENMVAYNAISVLASVPTIIVLTALLIFYSLAHRNAVAGPALSRAPGKVTRSKKKSQ